jgi:hypothetical protein
MDNQTIHVHYFYKNEHINDFRSVIEQKKHVHIV